MASSTVLSRKQLSVLEAPSTVELWNSVLNENDIVASFHGNPESELRVGKKAIHVGDNVECIKAIDSHLYQYVINDNEADLTMSYVHDLESLKTMAKLNGCKFGADPVLKQITAFIDKIGAFLDFCALQINPMMFSDPMVYRSKVLDCVGKLKEANKDISIFVQINLGHDGGTNVTDVRKLASYYNAVKDLVGLQLFYVIDGGEVDVCREFLKAVGFIT